MLNALDGEVQYHSVTHSEQLELNYRNTLSQNRLKSTQRKAQQFKTWASCTTQCRRVMIEEYLGTPESFTNIQTCITRRTNNTGCDRAEDPVELCDVCKDMHTFTDLVNEAVGEPFVANEQTQRRSIPPGVRTFTNMQSSTPVTRTVTGSASGASNAEKRDYNLNQEQCTWTGNKRLKIADTFQNELEEMRWYGRRLSQLCSCIPCFVHICMTENGAKTSSSNDGGNVLRANLTKDALMTRMRQCHGGVFCKKVRARCFRCMQTDHRSKMCYNIDSVHKPSQRDSRCRECFLNTVHGCIVHRESEFGRKDACPFSALMQLALICFSENSIQPYLLSFVNNECLKEPGRVKNARDFALWLQVDKAEHSAGLFKIIPYIQDLLQVKQLFEDKN